MYSTPPAVERQSNLVGRNFARLSSVMMLAMSIALVLPALIGLSVLSSFRQQEINQEIDSRLNEKINFLSHSLSVPIWNYDINEAKRIAEVVLTDHQVVRISVLDPAKKSLLHLEFPDRRMGLSRVAQGSLVSGGKPLGSVELEFDDSDSRYTFEEDRRFFVAVVVGQLVLAFLLILLVLRLGVLKPVARLIDFSNQLAEGNLDKPLDWHRQDEFGLLAQRIEFMRRSVLVLLAEQQTVLDNVPVGIAFVRDRTILRTNRQAELLFGYGPGEMTGQSTAVVYLDEAQCFSVQSEAYAAIATTSRGYEKELLLKRRDGTTFPALMRGCAIDPEAVKEGSVWVFDDVTARRKEEDALRREQQFSRSMLDSLPGIFYLYSYPENRLVLWNKRHESLLGFTAEEMANRHILEWHVPEEKEAVLSAIEEVMRVGQSSIEGSLVAKDGHLVYFDLTGVKFEDEHRSYFMGIGVDITARKQAESELEQYRYHLEDLVNARTGELDTANRQLTQAKETAERANQAKSQFLSSMSHELRTPMNAIIGFAQMLEYDSSLNVDQQDNVHEILKGGRHLLELINEVLDLARIESGRVELSLESLDLNELVESCRDLIQPLAAARRITLHLNVPPQAVVRGDLIRSKQALLNLLSNAVKYNREGGTIHLDTENIGDHLLRINVRDSGAGIAGDLLKELFQPFSRLKAEYSEIEGTGIGLTITRNLVELMGGTVGVESEVGVGSTFWIELPCEMRRTENSVEMASLKAGQPLNGSERAACVLCIDDNPVNLKLVAQMLSLRPSIHLLTAHTPGLGIELATTQRPDLILLDINMAHMDGYQVLEILLTDAHLKTTPIIAITANAMPRDIARGRAAGFADYLTKPLNLDVFLKTIDHFLSDHKEAP